MTISSRNHGAHFEKHKTAFEEGGGRDELEEDEDDPRATDGAEGGSDDSRAESIRVDEKRESDEDWEDLFMLLSLLGAEADEKAETLIGRWREEVEARKTQIS